MYIIIPVAYPLLFLFFTRLLKILLPPYNLFLLLLVSVFFIVFLLPHGFRLLGIIWPRNLLAFTDQDGLNVR